ncbi:hypothetical protein ScPMuIL_002453 [Solemya velum]
MQLAVLSLIVVAAVLTHGAHIDHTPDLTTKHFYVDTTHHVLVLKTPSGCYVHHLNRHENHDSFLPPDQKWVFEHGYLQRLILR